jgi:hypothetical protein
MRTSHKNYTIITEASKNGARGWELTLQIIGADGSAVVMPLFFGRDLIFATEELAHRAGVLLARYWIDGGDDTKRPARL